MENRVPLPTDNIFKFYALFGLVIIIFAFSASIYTQKNSNDFLGTAVVDLEELKALEAPTVREKARRAVLQRQIDVAVSDRETYKWSLGLLAGFGTICLMFGFSRWHTEIQPKQDELVDLQLAKLRHEVLQLKNSGRRVVRPRH
jgi:hypothetical protein